MKAVVISLKNKKSVGVRVERVFAHPKYRKIIKRHRNYQVGLSESIKREDLKTGQAVEIVSSRPESASKHFLLIKIYDSTKD